MEDTFRSPTYLIKNPYSYCFRISVPMDLQRHIGRKELRYSLKTGYLGKAKLKARRLASLIQQLFEELRRDDSRSMDLSDQEIKKLMLQHLEKIKAEYDMPAPFGPFDPPPLESDRELSGFIDALGGLMGELQAEMASGDYSKVTGGHQTERTVQVEGQSNSSKPKDKKLSAVIPLFVDEMKVRWEPKTKSEMEASLALFIEVVGDTSIQSINRATVAEYKATLKKLPPDIPYWYPCLNRCHPVKVGHMGFGSLDDFIKNIV